jgi:hypothetical protein
MKKRTYKHKKQKNNFGFIHIAIILVLVAGLTILALSLFVPSKKKDNDEPKPLDTAINETEKKKEEKKKEEQKDEGDNQDKTPEKYDGEKPESKDSFNASITKNEVVSGYYKLRVNIYELVSEGTCKLHMEANGGKDTLDRTAKIVNAGPDSSACEGFDIPTNGISSGTYKFTVTISNSSKTSTVEGTINI